MGVCFCIKNIFNFKSKKTRSVSLINPYSQEECSICLENIRDYNTTTMTKCGHIFHEKCIKLHFEYGRKYCPNCLQPNI